MHLWFFNTLDGVSFVLVDDVERRAAYMRWSTTAARLLLGAGFLFFGLNFFLHFLPKPELPPAAVRMDQALVDSWIMTTVKIVEVGAGALLVSNRLVPLALTLLAPILVNIVAFHVLLAPVLIAVPMIFLALELYLAWAYRDAFAPMLRVNATPIPRSQQ